MHRIVLANGCFDLLHVGHIRHLKEAREMGTLLVVGVTEDRKVGKPGRPVIPEDDRLESVRALGCVYEAELVCDSLEALSHWKPHVYVKGAEYEGRLLKDEIDFCEKHDIEIKFTKPSNISTTKLIERIKCVS